MRKNRSILIAAMILMIFIVSACATTGRVAEKTGAAAQPVITEIKLMDNAVEIKANGPFVYTVYKPSDPYRVIIDIPGVSTGLYKDKITSEKGSITEVMPSQVESPNLTAKIEVLLNTPSNVEPLYQDGVLTLKLSERTVTENAEGIAVQNDVSETGASKLSEPLPYEKDGLKGDAAKKDVQDSEKNTASAVNTEAGQSLQNANEITGLSFDPGEGIVRFIIIGNGRLNPSVFTLKGRIVIDVPDVSMKAQLPAIVLPPVKNVRAGKYKDRTRLVLDIKEGSDFDVSSSENSVIISIKKSETGIAAAQQENAATLKKRSLEDKKNGAGLKAQAEANAEAEPQKNSSGTGADNKESETLAEGSKYTGFRISLDFQESDIVPIFRLLSDISGYNIVVHPDVKGKLTMKLINVPWDQALDIILKTFSLGKEIEGNIVRIAPVSVFARENDERAKAKDAELKAEPVETRVMPISYADVAVVETAIKGSKILTSKGSLSVDKRTSTMVIKDIVSVFPQVEKLLSTLDKPTPQVMIEARIVEVNTSNSRDMGIQWGLTLSSASTLSSLGGLSTLGTGKTSGGSYLVDFPSAASSGSGSGFHFGTINANNTKGLDLQISALQTAGKGKIISNPKIMTVDNATASISQGDSIPIRKLTDTGTVSTEFKDYTLSLTVTPHVTPDNSISMTIAAKKEEPDWTRTSSEGTPASKKREANTSVLIKDGETIVIGGVFKNSSQDSDTGTPGLMKIPLLGWLFKNNKVTSDSSEMLIFITPRIIQKQ